MRNESQDPEMANEFRNAEAIVRSGAIGYTYALVRPEGSSGGGVAVVPRVSSLMT